MPEYKAPGVYVEEVERGPKTIEGVSTSVAGFLGKTERGPEKPRLVTSFADFRRFYGGVVDGNLAYAVKGFFDNGGNQCYVGRITRFEEEAEAALAEHHPAAETLGIHPGTVEFGWVQTGTTATRSIVITNHGDPAAGNTAVADPSVKLTGLSLTSQNHSSHFSNPELPQTNGSREVTLGPGEQYAIDVELKVNTGSNDAGNKTAKLEISHDGTAPSSPITVDLEGTGVDTGNKNMAISTGRMDFGSVAVGATRSETVTLSNLGGPGDDAISVSGASVGTSSGPFTAADVVGSSGSVSISPGESLDVEVSVAPDSTGQKSDSLEITHDGNSPSSPTTIPLAATAESAVLKSPAVGPGPGGEGVALFVEDATLYKPGENELFALTIRYWGDDSERAAAKAIYEDPAGDPDDAPDPDVEETYDNLSPEPASDNYYVSEVSGASNLVDLERVGSGRPANGMMWLHHKPASGIKQSVDVTHYQGSAADVDDRTGLAAFDEVDEITMVCAPDENGSGFAEQLRTAIVTHCENRKDRMAIFQAGENEKNPGQIRPPVSTSYAAYYLPWLNVTDPETGNEVTVPPGGHVAGVYARSDSEHGVHKAPANETLNGVLSLKINVSKRDQMTLNPRGVNCIREFQGRGIRVWGARTTSSDPSWKYVNVRRLFMYVEESIQEGTQWVVFENNDENLWARVRQTISGFLTTLWEDGALMGSTPDEAFYVKCDRSTMTQNDIDNGRLICEIGIAPVKPAEFVVFRISQWTAGAEGGG